MGVAVRRVMTDNGPGYVSKRFNRLCHQLEIRHIYTRPYTPRTNGKAERFIRTLKEQWAYSTCYQTSARTYSSSTALAQPLQSSPSPRRHRHDTADRSALRGEFVNTYLELTSSDLASPCESRESPDQLDAVNAPEPKVSANVGDLSIGALRVWLGDLVAHDALILRVAEDMRNQEGISAEFYELRIGQIVRVPAVEHCGDQLGIRLFSEQQILSALPSRGSKRRERRFLRGFLRKCRAAISRGRGFQGVGANSQN